MLRARISNPAIRVLDYAESDGRRLYDALHPGPLPVAVFDSSLDSDPDALLALDRGLKTAAGSRFLSVGADWNPSCHDPGGCKKPECKNDLSCRPLMAKRVEIFVMSKCRFAADRVQELQDVLHDLEPGIALSVQFIGTGDATSGFDSMHGADEVVEDLRQVCVLNHYRAANKFLDYIACRAKDMRNADWKSCATAKSGIDASVVQRCAEGAEGKRLLEASFKYSQSLGMSASPTFIINNKFKASASDAASIKKLICARNTGMHGCPKP
jgi:hypothetical protein